MKKILLIILMISVVGVFVVAIATNLLFLKFLTDLTDITLFSLNPPELQPATNLPNVELTKEVTLSFNPNAFYVPVYTGKGILYVGYGYGRSDELREVQAFFYNTETREVESETTIPDMVFSDACAGDSEIILSSDDNPSVAVRIQDNEIVTSNTDLHCSKAASLPIACGMGHEVFSRLLQNSTDHLLMCYHNRETTLHIVTEDGMMTKLTGAVTNTGGSGRYVISPMLADGQYLLHHTQSARSERTAVIDTSANSVTNIDLPDTKDARPSRGFGAGNAGLVFYTVEDGYLGHSEGRKAYLIQDDETTLLSNSVISGSLAIGSAGCTAILLAGDDGEIALQEFNLCAETGTTLNGSSCPAITQPDDTEFDWSKVNSDNELEVCLLELATNLKSPQKMADWLEEQGFSDVGVISTTPDREWLNATWDVETAGSPVPFRDNLNWFDRQIAKNNNYTVQVVYYNGTPEDTSAMQPIL